MAQAPSAKYVEQTAALLAHDPAKAETQARAILKIVPDDPRALLILGSARRRQGDPVAAYRVLAPPTHITNWVPLWRTLAARPRRSSRCAMP